MTGLLKSFLPFILPVRQMEGRLPVVARLETVRVNVNREVICIALAAAEVCWLAPIFLIVIQAAVPHPSPLLWFGMLVLLLGFSYFYRALVAANLAARLQQGLLVAGLLFSIMLVLRLHIYAGSELRGAGWLLQPLRSFADLTSVIPLEFLAIVTLIHLWARGIHLARRSLSDNSIGFSFRSGVVILVGVALIVGLYGVGDISGFIPPYFFFALIAVALARLEEIGRVPNSTNVRFGGFWLGWMVGSVSLLSFLGTLLAAVFVGGGLEQVLRWLSPLLIVVGVLIGGLMVLVFALLEWIVSLVPIDWTILKAAIWNLMNQLQSLSALFNRPVESANLSVPSFLGAVQATGMTSILVMMIVLVVLLTWWRVQQSRRSDADESRESMWPAGTLADNLRAMLQSGRDRLGELAGLVDRFGLGSRLLSAITIRRIYASLVRLATELGHPRRQAQTPNEYLETLHEAFPGSEVDVGLITDAYVNAHYGQVPDNREGLERIRACWARVQAQGREKEGRRGVRHL